MSNVKNYTDNNKNNKIDESGTIYEGNYATNVHPNSYTKKKGIVSWFIGRWSVGCTVVNDLFKYWNVLLKNIHYNEPVTYTGLKEW